VMFCPFTTRLTCYDLNHQFAGLANPQREPEAEEDSGILPDRIKEHRAVLEVSKDLGASCLIKARWDMIRLG
jgi:hypothetical protein